MPFGRANRKMIFVIDPGTTYIKGSMPQYSTNGKIIREQEPSCVAIETLTDGKTKIKAVGSQAKEEVWEMHAKNVEVIWPIEEGVMVVPEIVAPLIANLCLKLYYANFRGGLFRAGYKAVKSAILRMEEENPFFQQEIEVIVGVSPSSDAMYKSAVQTAARDAFHQAADVKVYLVTHTIAAAIGSGLSVRTKEGNMILVLGGGTADVSVIANYREINPKTKPYGGTVLDKAIQRGLKNSYGIQIPLYRAEAFKIAHGQAISPNGEAQTIQYGGGAKPIEFSNEELFQYINPTLEKISNMCGHYTESIPSNICRIRESVANNGLTVVGGPALLKKLQDRLAADLDITINIAKDPQEAGLVGLEILSERKDILYEVAVNPYIHHTQ
ncbi:MAG: rod shape-determining protein [Candidatus Doudnabacteria bacterium]|nr:rod shape-determining protein [Candidatus Doudnabacteria bacterium]